MLSIRFKGKYLSVIVIETTIDSKHVNIFITFFLMDNLKGKIDELTDLYFAIEFELRMLRAELKKVIKENQASGEIPPCPEWCWCPGCV